MVYNYKTNMTCARNIKVELDGDIIKNVEFSGGCDGNLKGISALIAGMKISDVEQRLTGIKCNAKPTSCPDQLAKALRCAYESQN